MPIRYYAGVEGSGKTCMMTRDLYMHVASGGTVLAFPGYELFGKNKKQVLSTTIEPQTILQLLEDETDIDAIRKLRLVLVADEVTNFMNHHTWWNLINDVVAAVQQQRRKFNIAMMMTGHHPGELPPDVRQNIHEVVYCTDMHSFNHDIPIGTYCQYQKNDLRGMLSHPKYRWSIKRKFEMKKWYKHFDTHATVSFMQRFNKIKFTGTETLYGPDGKPIIKEDAATVRERGFIDTEILIARKITELQEEEKLEITTAEYAMVVGELGLPNNISTRRRFASRGLAYDKKLVGYRIVGGSI